VACNYYPVAQKLSISTRRCGSGDLESHCASGPNVECFDEPQRKQLWFEWLFDELHREEAECCSAFAPPRYDHDLELVDHDHVEDHDNLEDDDDSSLLHADDHRARDDHDAAAVNDDHAAGVNDDDAAAVNDDHDDGDDGNAATATATARQRWSGSDDHGSVYDHHGRTVNNGARDDHDDRVQLRSSDRSYVCPIAFDGHRSFRCPRNRRRRIGHIDGQWSRADRQRSGVVRRTRRFGTCSSSPSTGLGVTSSPTNIIG
jgi:hypothetical protein